MAVVLMILLLAVPAWAGEGIQIHGFAMDTYTPDNEPVDHIRLIISDELQKQLIVKATLTPVGPLSQLSYLEVIWTQPTKAISSIAVGRTFPVFGRIWYDRRVDMVPTIFYSDIYLPLAAVDTGVTVVGSGRQLRWTFGLYAGDTVLGNDTSPNASLRGEYRLIPRIILSASQRISAVPASGVDIVWTKDSLRLTGETVTCQGEAEMFLLGEFNLNPKTILALQREWLRREKRWTTAVTQRIGHNLEIKVGYHAGQRSVNRWLGQAVVRW